MTSPSDAPFEFADLPWPPAADAQLRSALEDLTAAVVAVWRDPEFLRWRWTFRDERAVVTTRATTDAAPRLPATGRLVRGHPGVEVSVASHDTTPAGDSVAAWVQHALTSRGVPSGQTPAPDPGPDWRRVIAARDIATTTILQTPRLGVAVACSAGRRIDTVDVVDQQLRSDQGKQTDPGDLFGYMALRVLREELTAAAVSLGLQTTNACRAFEDTAALASAVHTRLVQIARRERFHYQGFAYLNGPVLDTDEPLLLLDDLVAKAEGVVPIWVDRVALVPATDALLGHAVADAARGGLQLPVGIDRCNAILVLDIALPVDAPPGRFYDMYPVGVRIAERALEALRLVRAEDLGMSHLTIRNAAPHAPWAPTGEWVEPGARAAEWTPRRPAYAAANPQALTAEEAQEVRELVRQTMWPPAVKGLEIARRRTRDAYERYAADDPERLLEFAITLEALLLNDQASKGELQFRLGLRAARLLGRDLADRHEIAATVRDLYAMRSRLAHGDTLGAGRPAKAAAEATKIKQTLARASALTRRTLQHVLRGGVLATADIDALRTWWKDVELG